MVILLYANTSCHFHPQLLCLLFRNSRSLSSPHYNTCIILNVQLLFLLRVFSLSETELQSMDSHYTGGTQSNSVSLLLNCHILALCHFLSSPLTPVHRSTLAPFLRLVLPPLLLPSFTFLLQLHFSLIIVFLLPPSIGRSVVSYIYYLIFCLFTIKSLLKYYPL